MRTFQLPGDAVPIAAEAELVVAGGGSAGCAAAVTAARPWAPTAASTFASATTP
jgi:hypothetical protein